MPATASPAAWSRNKTSSPSKGRSARKARRVEVALSGGADSLALAACAAFVGARAGWLTGAVVVDHGLQPGSAEVAARAAEQAPHPGLGPAQAAAAKAAGVCCPSERWGRTVL